jgi:hypothetical protein
VPSLLCGLSDIRQKTSRHGLWETSRLRFHHLICNSTNVCLLPIAITGGRCEEVFGNCNDWSGQLSRHAEINRTEKEP